MNFHAITLSRFLHTYSNFFGICVGVFASGFLLSTAFPPLKQFDTAWFALVPLIIILRNVQKPKHGLLLGWIYGLGFWLPNLSWLCAMPDQGIPFGLIPLAHFSLAAYSATYMGLFGYAAAVLWRFQICKTNPWLRMLLSLFAEPILWVGSEYLRSTVFTGFAWNPLSASQYTNLPLLYSCSWAGVGFLSALIVSVNSGIASLLERFFHQIKKKICKDAFDVPQRKNFLFSLELTLAVLFVLFCWLKGVDFVREVDKNNDTLPQWRFAIVHPELPSIFDEREIDYAEENHPLTTYAELISAVKPDITIWPETCLPGYMPYDKFAADLIRYFVAKTDAQLLAGGIEFKPPTEEFPNPKGQIFNSAFLFTPDARIGAVYQKFHLVPFGEFIPGEGIFPSLAQLSPVGFSCTAGTDDTPIKIYRSKHNQTTNSTETIRISPLICFEDAFGYLARRVTNKGTDVLINLTNDSWFKGSAQAEQHLAQAVMRAVENQRPMIRSANTGVSCIILANGRVIRRLGDGSKEATSGFITGNLGITQSPKKTPFTKYGSWILNIPSTTLLLLTIVLGFFLRGKIR